MSRRSSTSTFGLVLAALSSACNSILGVGDLRVVERDDAATIVDAPDAADTGLDARPPADAAPGITSLVVFASTGANLYVVDPDDLSYITVPIAGASGFDSPIADGPVIWAFELGHVWSFDAATLAVRPGYPVALDITTQCSGLRAFATGGAVFCAFDPAGTTDDQVQLWGGSPVRFSGVTTMIARPWLVRGSPTRVLVSYGTNHTEVAIYDSSLTAIPGSPLDVLDGGAIPVVSDDEGVIAIGTPSALRGYRRSTLSPLGSASMPSAVVDVGFAPPDAIVATLADGSAVLVSATTLSGTTGPIAVAPSPLYAPVYDASAKRLFVLSNDTLYALDASTLATVGHKTFPTYVGGIVARH
jgi:hypothetical protein